MRIYAALIYVFLYAPIALIVFFSFNAGRYAMDWQGFSVEWYGQAFTNPIVIKALVTSLIIAGATAFFATVIGTLCALGLERMRGWLRPALRCAHLYRHHGAGRRHRHLDADRLRHALRRRQSGARGDRHGRACRWACGRSSPRMSCSTWRWSCSSSGHGLPAWTGAWSRPRTIFMRRPSAPSGRWCCRSLAPSILAGLLLAFTFSFEDFIIAFFVAGPNTTLPIYVFSSIRRGVTPEINAIGTVVLLTSLAC